MLPEERHNLGQLEHDFRLLLKQFRALLRWGVDKAFQEMSSSTQELLEEVRKLLDKKSTEYTPILLEKIANNLTEMEHAYTERKIALLNHSNATINFLERVLADDSCTDPDDIDNINQRNEFIQELEQARLASQNDDWLQAEKITRSIITQYLDIRQTSLASNNPPDPLSIDALQKIEEQLLKGAFCKLLSLNELQHTLITTTASQVTATKIAILGNDAYIEKLFSFLSNKELQFTNEQQTGERCAAMLRIPASRNHVVYVIGIAVNLLDSFTQLRPLLGKLSAALINFEQNAYTQIEIEESLFICFDQLPRNQIHCAGPESSLLADKNELNSLKIMKKNYIPSVTQTDIIAWIKNRYSPQQ